MKFDYDAPKKYDYRQPMFDTSGNITDRVLNGLENILAAYSELAKIHAKTTENNIKNYALTNIYVVGSGARENKIHSDMDLLLIAPHLDEQSAKNMKVFLSYLFFCDRPKPEAIDVYIRQKDIYPERAGVDISDKVKDLLDKYISFTTSK